MSFSQHDCEEHLRVRQREQSNGTAFVWQCAVCGEQRGGAIPKKKYLAEEGGKAPPKFDASIQNKFQEHRDECLEELKSKRPSFDEARDKIETDLNVKLSGLIDYAGLDHGVSLAQCSLNKYKKKRFKKGLTNLDRLVSESELKKWLEEHLSQDFYLKAEVEGVHLTENKGVRIDYILKAKPHLIEQGFTPNSFGVEVKYIPQDKGFTRKLSRAFWQTISYNDCEFNLDGEKWRPQFCLLFSNLSFSEERKWLNDFEGEHSSDYAQLHAMENVANHARVGTMVIRGEKSKFLGWVVKFSAANYFSCSQVKGKWQYKMSNEKIINKVRVGSF